MKIRVGYELIYAQPTPIIMVLGTRFTRASDVIAPGAAPAISAITCRASAAC